MHPNFDKQIVNIQQIYDLAVQIGIDNDPRGRKKIEKILICFFRI